MSVSSRPIAIIGSSTFGRLVRVLVADAGRSFAGYLDDYSTGNGILGTLDKLDEPAFSLDVDLALAIGYRHLEARLDIFRRARRRGFEFPSLVHPRAFVSTEATLGSGCIVMAGSNIDAFAHVGEACVLWPGSIVSHDARVGENTFISPNATVCGFSQIGHSSFLGAGCTVVDNVEVPAASFIKASQRVGRSNP